MSLSIAQAKQLITARLRYLATKDLKLTRRLANLEDHRRLISCRIDRLTVLSANLDEARPDQPILHDLPEDPAANHPWWWHATLDLIATSPNTAHSAPELHRHLTDLGFSVTRATLAQRLAAAARTGLIDRPSRGRYRKTDTAA